VKEQLPASIRVRIAREFPEKEREQAEALMSRYLEDRPDTAAPTWKVVLDLARGDLDSLRWFAGADNEVSDWRDRVMGRDSWRTLAQLVATRGRGPLEIGVLGKENVATIRRDYLRNLDRAARFFPAEQVDEVMLWMGASWSSNAEEILALAHRDVSRLRCILEARPASAADPSAPPVLAGLPCAAAALIRRDFAPERWEAAARVAAGAPRMRGEGGALAWLLAAEYAAGDVDDFAWAVRMLREDESELYHGVGRRRAERRAAGLE